MARADKVWLPLPKTVSNIKLWIHQSRLPDVQSVIYLLKRIRQNRYRSRVGFCREVKMFPIHTFQKSMQAMGIVDD